MEKETLIHELIQGMELAKQLRQHLGTASSVESMDLLVQRILCSYEKALRILKFNEPMSMLNPQQNMGSPRSDDIDKDNQDTRDVSNKRKMMPRWTDNVRVSSESLLDGTHDDGCSWRKYGQKDILGAKYPRSYYRCTYRHTQNCWATKQVQRSDDDPTIFEITYRGTHVCVHGHQAVPSPASPEKLEHKSINPNNNYNQQLQSQDKGLMVNTDGLDNKEMAPSFSFPSTSFGWLKTENHSFNTNILNSFSSPFTSPATPELNYFSASHSQINTSATNSPIVDLDFSIDQVELDPNFQFDTTGFFS